MNVIFHTHDLLSRHGFEDGDMLDELCDKYDLHVDSSTLLVEVVKRYVLPELRKHHQLEAFIDFTIHNPIRLETVDGEYVDNCDDNEVTLRPAKVEVSEQAIVAIAKEELAAEQQAGTGKCWTSLEKSDFEFENGPLGEFEKMQRIREVLERRYQRQMGGLNG